MKKDLFLVIDMQNVYTEGNEWHCPNIEKAKDNIIRILKNGSVDAVFTRFIASDNPRGTWITYNEENAGVNGSAIANELMDELKPFAETYPVFDKSEYSSVSIDEVRKRAEDAIGDTNVVVSGVVAECCVLFTVTGLIDLGCDVIYLTDAVAGIDDATEAATITVLSGLAPLHVKCMTTEEYLNSKA